MNNYIQIYDNVLDDSYCDELREKFDKNISQQEQHEQGIGYDQTGPKSFLQIKLGMPIPGFVDAGWKEDVLKLSKVFAKFINQYQQDCNILPGMWPDKTKDFFNFEQIRIKKYLPNDKDEFGPHIDASALRFLAFFIYLDDNEKGETAFPQIEFDSPCKKGSLLMFPPLWPWLHAGLKPINKPKYIVGSYLHYKNSKRFNPSEQAGNVS